jgi:hypothetical protein
MEMSTKDVKTRKGFILMSFVGKNQRNGNEYCKRKL